jgi:hypothetical protein
MEAALQQYTIWNSSPNAANLNGQTSASHGSPKTSRCEPQIECSPVE